MLWIFDRREVAVTRDPAELQRIRSQLAAAGISCRAQTCGGAGRYHGVPGIDLNAAYEYRVFVSRRDFDAAQQCLGRR